MCESKSVFTIAVVKKQNITISKFRGFFLSGVILNKKANRQTTITVNVFHKKQYGLPFSFVCVILLSSVFHRLKLRAEIEDMNGIIAKVKYYVDKVTRQH